MQNELSWKIALKIQKLKKNHIHRKRETGKDTMYLKGTRITRP